MGYYTGSGVTSTGGSTVSVHENFVWYGAHNVYQRHTVRTTRRSGVSLADATSEAGACNLSTHQFTWTSSGVSCYHYSPNCKGSTKSVQFSQIGGSNLYELTVTNDTIQAKMDSGDWQS